jgi:HK97 family phage portal protein
MWPFNRKQIEQKAVSAGTSSFFFPLGAGAFMARKAEEYAREGYAENAIANACVHKISSAASSVGLSLRKGADGDTIDDHDILDLLKRPNPTVSGSDFFYGAIAWRLIAGEVFVVRQPFGSNGKQAKGKPTQLWLLEPSRVEVKAGMFGMPIAYHYQTLGGEKIIFPVDPLTGLSDVLHLKTFNPLHASRGLSPMSAAAYSIDTHNAALRWNKALLDNSARPSGALVLKSKDGTGAGELSGDQYARLKAEMDERYDGAGNAGKPLLLEGGLEWEAMGLTPAEMDFDKGIWTAATHVCAVFQVPPQMIGIPGTSTFANFEQATLTFWEDVVVPLLESTLDGLNHWLVPMYGDDSLYLEVDKDTIRLSSRGGRSNMTALRAPPSSPSMRNVRWSGSTSLGPRVMRYWSTRSACRLTSSRRTFTSIRLSSRPRKANLRPKSPHSRPLTLSPAPPQLNHDARQSSSQKPQQAAAAQREHPQAARDTASPGGQECQGRLHRGLRQLLREPQGT